MAQSVERRLGKAEVTGSIPVNSFTAENLYDRFSAFSLLEDSSNNFKAIKM